MKIIDVLRQSQPIYFATPFTLYRRGLTGAFVDAADVASRVAGKYKLSIIVPILNSYPMCFHGELPARDGGFWERFNAPIIEASRACIVAKMDGWDESKGVLGEIRDFKEAKKTVVYCDPETLDLSFD